MRFVIIALVVVGFGMLAGWLADNPGGIAVDWAGWRVETSIPVVAAFLFALVLVSAFLFWLWGLIAGGPGRLGAIFRGGRREKGYRALTEGMAAIAAGEAQVAVRAASRAEALLDSPPIAKLLRAQAAQLAGDEDTAEEYFEAMLKSPETELVALRGLLIHAGRAGDHQRALELAARARALRPGATWAVRALFDLQVGAEDWDSAIRTLEAGQRSGVYDKGLVIHRKAVMETAQALRLEAGGDLKAAIAKAADARKHDPDHVPATVVEARLLAAEGSGRRAARHLSDGWKRTRHPEIARAFLDLKPSETAKDKLHRFDGWDTTANDHPEGLLVRAQLLLEAGDIAAARDAAERAIRFADVVDQRFCRLMVQIEERAEDGAARAREWLVRLSESPAAAHWECDHCGEVARDWAPRCPHCDQFDTLHWRHPHASTEPVTLVEARPAAETARPEPVTVEVH